MNEHSTLICITQGKKKTLEGHIFISVRMYCLIFFITLCSYTF